MWCHQYTRFSINKTRRSTQALLFEAAFCAFQLAHGVEELCSQQVVAKSLHVVDTSIGGQHWSQMQVDK